MTFQELYAYAHSTTDETADEDEVGRMQGDLIDLEPELRDAVVLALPNHPLCREDCPGLCPECGAHWDELPADHSHRQVDPRWAALDQFNRELQRPSTDRRRESQPWPYPSARCRAATPGRAGRSGRRPPVATVACPQCRSPKLPHAVCTVCGTYNGRQVVEV